MSNELDRDPDWELERERDCYAELKFESRGLGRSYKSQGITEDDLDEAQSHLAYYLFLDVPDIDDRDEIVETVLSILDHDLEREFIVPPHYSLLLAAVDGIVRTLPKRVAENDNNDIAWTLIETYLKFIFDGIDLPDASEEDEEESNDTAR
jgi:hypothetical protein